MYNVLQYCTPLGEFQSDGSLSGKSIATLVESFSMYLGLRAVLGDYEGPLSPGPRSRYSREVPLETYPLAVVVGSLRTESKVTKAPQEIDRHLHQLQIPRVLELGSSAISSYTPEGPEPSRCKVLASTPVQNTWIFRMMYYCTTLTKRKVPNPALDI